MKNVDKAFVAQIPLTDPPTEIVPGLKHYLETHHTSDIVFDARVSYRATNF